jgi:hypothetical protein
VEDSRAFIRDIDSKSAKGIFLVARAPTKRTRWNGHKLAANLADFQRSRTAFNGSLGAKRRTINALVASKRCRAFIAIHRTMPAPPFFPRQFYLNSHFP